MDHLERQSDRRRTTLIAKRLPHYLVWTRLLRGNVRVCERWDASLLCLIRKITCAHLLENSQWSRCFLLQTTVDIGVTHLISFSTYLYIPKLVKPGIKHKNPELLFRASHDWAWLHCDAVVCRLPKSLPVLPITARLGARDVTHVHLINVARRRRPTPLLILI